MDPPAHTTPPDALGRARRIRHIFVSITSIYLLTISERERWPQHGEGSHDGGGGHRAGGGPARPTGPPPRRSGGWDLSSAGQHQSSKFDAITITSLWA